MDKKLMGGIIILVGIIAVVLFFALKKNDSIAYLNIKCMSKDLSKEYHVSDKFECDLIGETFNITIKDISSETIKLQADKKGLSVNENGKISTTETTTNFELKKDKELILSLAAEDANNANIVINWK